MTGTPVTSRYIMSLFESAKNSLKSLDTTIKRRGKHLAPQYQDELESILSDIEKIVEEISEEVYKPRKN